LTELFHRFAEVQLPEVIAVDVKDLKRRKKMKSLLSPPLIEAMQTALESNEQIILFHNRRGFAPLITCGVCDWVPRCPRCDVALTYHKQLGRLTCHYCGCEQEVPVVCPSCGEKKPTSIGFGTEQVEEEVHRLFPGISTLRLDTDTSKNLTACTRILNQFQAGKAQVLIGTQLVSKGLDFSRVRLVGILNADQMLSYPDFRSHERAFQLMAQVGGRGGRRDQRGLVIIQTSHIDNAIVKQVVNQDYAGFFNEEMTIRQLFSYPPYSRFIHVSIRDMDVHVAKQAAEYMAKRCGSIFGDKVLGPDKPAVSRIRNQHRQSVYIKLDVALSAAEAKQCLYRIREELKQQTLFKSVQVVFDVDPV
jgi:primosomal protein N' (replication factor Y)